MSTTNSTAVSNGHQASSSLGTDFPALRHAALKCTLQIIESYREAVAHLMEISPLAEHVDMREHYIAFVDLETFGLQSSKALESSSTGGDQQQRPPIAIRELKETAQIALVQQSEYLRRFSLAFCDRVREDNALNKAGVLKHIRDLLVTVRKINDKLSTVLEYHQAMGFDMEKSRALMPKSPVRSASNPSQKFVPLRSIYTSMFSTGLHLQHTLLKLRRLERLFEDFEKGHHHHKRGRKSPPIPVDEGKLLQWLGDFQEIQTELNACIGCLDDGVTQISSLRHKEDESSKDNEPVQVPKPDKCENGHPKKVIVDEQTESPTFDEVFEAYIAEAENEVRQVSEQLDQVDVKMAKQSTRLMKELKGVLVHKAKEHEVREAKALSRQRGEDPFLFDSSSVSGNDSNKFEDSFVNEDSASDSSSNPSDCPTVRSASPKRTAISNNTIARSVSGQFLDSDDEETASESCGNFRREDHQNGSSGDNQLLQLPISSLRSLSTPDLKNIDPTAAGSYKAFAAKDDDEDTLTSSSSSASSGWESADELETCQHPLQSYRRPLPPAPPPPDSASIAKDSPKKKLKAKRQRNRSNVNNGNASLYLRLNEKAGNGPLSIPDQRNFDGGIAVQAASLALAMRNGKNSTQVQDEQVFGDSDDSSS